jgi:hypothetical protein
MKKIFAILAFVLIGAMSYAQTWTNVGGNILTDPAFGAANFVGIKTTTPNADLTVGSTTDKADVFIRTAWAPPTPVSGSTTTAQIEIWGDPAGANLYRNVVRLNTLGQYEMLQTIKTPAGNLAFLFVGYATRKFEMRAGILDAEFLNAGNTLFNQTGSVGVGVTAFKPGVKFQVNGGAYVEGRVRCHEVEVALAPTFVWPDYVFNSSYKLRPLSEVESFINTNKHLPGVPSQAEVATNGVKLGEMNATLLQKVEELTLYMINLQKENDALKARVSNLEK